MNNNIQMLAALLMAGVAFTSCSSDVEDAVGPVSPTLVKTYTLTVDATKGSDVITRALADNTSTLTNTWETSDEIYVKKGETWATGNLAPQSAGATAQLKGDLSDVTFAVNDQLTLQYPSSTDADYTTGQDGTLAKIASNYDYSKAENVKVTAVNAGNITTEAATFVSQQAVVKFTLKNDDADLTVTSLTVKVGETSYAVTPASATNVLYVALPAFSDQTITLTATGSDSKTYTYTKTGVSFSNGTYYRVNVKMTAASTPGLLTGAFTINSGGTQVHFAQGNLQYQASSNTWRFAENQWDYVGDASNGNVYVSSTKSNNASISSSYAGWIDLFGWGTSNHSFASGYGSAYQPWSTSTTNTDYGPTDGTSGLTGTYAEGDWGTNMGSGWRTLTKDEWQWMLGPYSVTPNPGTNCRTSSTIGGVPNARWVKAVVHSTKGLIIFPDGLNWNATTMGNPPTTSNVANNDFTYNTLTGDQWSVLEFSGCVFLPAAGFRNGTTVGRASSYGYYWSSTPRSASYAYNVYFNSGNLNPADFNNRRYGYSVRLVRQVE